MLHVPELYIFEGLSKDEVNYFLLMSEPMEFGPGEIIIAEGDASDNRAYFLEVGEVSVSQSDAEICRLQEGSLFGEIALITNDVRTATITATSKVRVLAIARDEFLLLAKTSGNFEHIQKEIFKRIKENFIRAQQ